VHFTLKEKETMVQFSTDEDLEEKIFLLETKMKSLEVLCGSISTDMTEQETSAESFRENGGNVHRENFQSRTKSLRNRFGNQSKYKA